MRSEWHERELTARIYAVPTVTPTGYARTDTHAASRSITVETKESRDAGIFIGAAFGALVFWKR